MKTFAALLPFWVWFALSILFYGLGEYFSKRWATAPGVALTVSILVVYLFSDFFWIPMVKLKGSLALAGTLWLVAATVVTFLIGVLVFKESVHKLQILGFILAILALILLEVS